MTPPKVTVITVVRNAVKTIAATIESVLAQKYKEVEYLIIDGMSSDGTAEIAQQYEKHISAIVSEPDEGIADAFNKGARLATGQAVLYMNAGDTFVDTGSLEALVDGVPPGLDLSESIVYGDFLMALPSGLTVACAADHQKIGIDNRAKICHQASLIGIKIQRRFTYDLRLPTAMDYDFWLRCIGAKVPIFKIPRTISTFEVGGVSGNPDTLVARAIDNETIKLLNKRNPKTVWMVAQMFGQVAAAAAKSHLRDFTGDRLYELIKRGAATLPLQRRTS